MQKELPMPEKQKHELIEKKPVDNTSTEELAKEIFGDTIERKRLKTSKEIALEKADRILAEKTINLNIIEEKKIGEGGYGEIYEIKTTTGACLTLKKAKKDGMNAIETELAIQEQLGKHPNILRAIHADTSEGFILFENFPNATILDTKKQRTLEEKLFIMDQVCQALSHAHNKNVFHRDVRPVNILVDDRGNIKLTDFGIGRIVEDLEYSGPKTGLETPKEIAYIAPEQRKGQEGDSKTDQYQAGVILYELLTNGEQPGNNVPKELRQYELDERIIDIGTKALEKNPANRYEKIKDFLENLRNFKKKPVEKKVKKVDAVEKVKSEEKKEKILYPEDYKRQFLQMCEIEEGAKLEFIRTIKKVVKGGVMKGFFKKRIEQIYHNIDSPAGIRRSRRGFYIPQFDGFIEVNEDFQNLLSQQSCKSHFPYGKCNDVLKIGEKIYLITHYDINSSAIMEFDLIDKNYSLLEQRQHLKSLCFDGENIKALCKKGCDEQILSINPANKQCNYVKLPRELGPATALVSTKDKLLIGTSENGAYLTENLLYTNNKNLYAISKLENIVRMYASLSNQLLLLRSDPPIIEVIDLASMTFKTRIALPNLKKVLGIAGHGWKVYVSDDINGINEYRIV